MDCHTMGRNTTREYHKGIPQGNTTNEFALRLQGAEAAEPAQAAPRCGGAAAAAGGRLARTAAG